MGQPGESQASLQVELAVFRWLESGGGLWTTGDWELGELESECGCQLAL